MVSVLHDDHCRTLSAVYDASLLTAVRFSILLGRKPAKVGFLGADPTWKATWRLIRSWICHNHKVYYTVSIFWAFGIYQCLWHSMVGYYRARNAHRSLNYAI